MKDKEQTVIIIWLIATNIFSCFIWIHAFLVVNAIIVQCWNYLFLYTVRSNCTIIYVCMSFHWPGSCILVFEYHFYDIFCIPTYFGRDLIVFIQYCFICRPADLLCLRILGLNPFFCNFQHWRSDALTTVSVVIKVYPKTGAWEGAEHHLFTQLAALALAINNFPPIPCFVHRVAANSPIYKRQN